MRVTAAQMAYMYLSTLAAAGTSVWIRRESVATRWEGAPTLVTVALGLATYLLSPFAEPLGTFLHSLTGLWNLENLLSHILFLVAAAAAVYLFLGYFGDDESLQLEFTRRVSLPLSVAIPLMIAFFIWGDAGSHYELRFITMECCPNTMAYWAVLNITAIYLLTLAIRLLLVIRLDERSPIIGVYITALGLLSVACAVQLTSVLTNLCLFSAAMIIWSAGAVAWCIGAAWSWIRKARRQASTMIVPPVWTERRPDEEPRA